MTNKFLIADLKILITSEYDKKLEQSHFPYKSDFDGNADITFVITKTSDRIENNFLNVTKLCPGKYFANSNGSDTVIDYDEQSGVILATTQFSSDYSEVCITKYDVTKLYNISDECFIVNLVDSAMHYIMRKYGGLVFHSSALSYNGKGVVFSAESGTGKSTHTALWEKEFDGVKIINDDTPIIRTFGDGKVMLYGTPWAGSTGINSNESVPLKAIVFLSRSESNCIKRVSFAEVTKNFFDALSSSLTPEMYSETLDITNKICRTVPIYTLACNMEPDAAKIAREVIYGDISG